MTSVPSWVIRQIRESTNLEPFEQGGVLYIPIPGLPQEPIGFKVVARRRLSPERVRQLLSHWSESGGPADNADRVVIATRSLTNQTRRTLKDNGISWVEKETGVLMLKGTGLHVEKRGSAVDTGEPSSNTSTSPSTSLTGKSGLYAETLLLHYRDAQIKTRESASEAGISHSLAGRILRRLDEEGITQSEGTGRWMKRWLADPAALLDLWTQEEDRSKWERHGIHYWAQSPRDRYRQLLKSLESELDWAIGGTAAANLYAPTLTSIPDPEVWVAAEIPPKHIAQLIDGELVESGANLFVWHHPQNVPLQHRRTESSDEFEAELTVISRYRAYVEAESAGGRSDEVASRLRNNLSLTTSSSIS